MLRTKARGRRATWTGVFSRGGVLYRKVGKELYVSVSDTMVLFFLRWQLNVGVCACLCVCVEEMKDVSELTQ